ncbi:probable G-protein coupled receptor Mth-like 3 [Diorhabda sublineata]|uniref:probable G-protein coupled receptor Mth-like 3 n=1 Tax=Diorhabda sublineata TaxID=1163346 RepID=UPI0024E16A14|nr:probable G-protein coupled receptor Mth-like 3 [Diorhabda sublineata]XP_056632951.1 probable G-protein coupled receptor Mth-like 3 [Diorhabda sublineata]XP_056632952.1 probable G-protein coupled receptor Mth-like 3 [Diorhabda sublineata]
MDTIYTGRVHGFTNLSRAGLEPALTEESILSLMVVLGSSISLVALVFAFITYSLFSDLRNLSGTTLMNLLAALFMTQLLYVVGVGGVSDSELCISLAFALQYARLSIFFWMMLMAHNMYNQFRTGLQLAPVVDNDITKHFIRYSLFGWGLPLLLLFVSVLIQYEEKGGKLLDTMSLKKQNCWFLDPNAFIYGLISPSFVIIIITFNYLIRSTFLSIYIISFQTDIRTKEKMNNKRTLQILLFVKITTVITVVMILSTFAKFFNESDTFRVAYHVSQGTQGLLVALLVTCNCRVLKLYTKSLKKRANKHVDSAASYFSKSTSLQLLTWKSPETV